MAEGEGFIILGYFADCLYVRGHETSAINKDCSPDWISGVGWSWVGVFQILLNGDQVSSCHIWAGWICFCRNVSYTAKTTGMLYLSQHWWRVLFSQSHRYFVENNKLFECTYLFFSDWLKDLSWWVLFIAFISAKVCVLLRGFMQMSESLSNRKKNVY